ncbi:hypothetical protein COU80_00650 [Candidatus Peregrinibacteria bacterium CG10_big_fil_rev_8_21_14_0_10_55_24]|nr:MAG: hypothetical protein COU80_00650 [Candidatus Peregrinibacteria bacterium CG10_big_fil_rev_8_21_14_0_10_55_24]
MSKDNLKPDETDDPQKASEEDAVTPKEERRSLASEGALIAQQIAEARKNYGEWGAQQVIEAHERMSGQ